MRHFQKYFFIFWLSCLRTLKNYKALIGLSIFLVTCLLIFANLWKIAAANLNIKAFNADNLLWYIALNEWVLLAIPDVQDEIEEDLRSGRLAYQLPRPISYLGSLFAEGLGALTVNLVVLGIVAFGFTWITVRTLPFEGMGVLISLIFGFMAGMVALIYLMMIGLSAFWLHDVTPFYWLWEKFLFMFGGLLLPLSIYPAWMQTLAIFTPFPAILGARSAFALSFSTSAVLSLSITLLTWGVLGLLALKVVYRRSLSILNVEGG